MPKLSSNRNEVSAGRILKAIGEIKTLVTQIDKLAQGIVFSEEADTLTTAQVIEEYGISDRQLVSFRKKGLPYIGTKPAKYYRSDIEEYLKVRRYTKTPEGWRQKKATT